MVPAGSTAAMTEVPPDSAGIGSGLFNACRQVGTAMGLALLGSIATSVVVADWPARLVSSLRPRAAPRPAGSVPR